MRNLEELVSELQKANLALIENERRYNDLSHDAADALNEVAASRGHVSRLKAELSVAAADDLTRNDESVVTRPVDKFNAEREAKANPFRR